MLTSTSSRTMVIRITEDCKAIKYIKDMGIPMSRKRVIDMALEEKRKYDWGLYLGLYKNKRSIFVRIGNSLFRIELGEGVPMLDLKLSLNYLLNHNGLVGLKGLCEDCFLKNGPMCTMRLLSKAI